MCFPERGVLMYENGKMRPIETVPGMGGGEDKGG
jgi:hypothetical protein